MPTQQPTQSALAAYEHLAPFYDDFTAGYDHGAWLADVLAIAEGLQPLGTRLLDVACGTGKSFTPLLERGWTVTGCDLSPAMVERARAKVLGGARLVVADMRDLPLLGSFDLVLCADDALNYLADPGDLTAALSGMARNLATNGLVVFDLSTLRTYRTFFAATEERGAGDVVVTWQGHASPRQEPGSTVEATVSTAALEDSSATPRQTVHRQRHFLPEEILESLAAAGLEAVAIYGHGLDGRFQQPLDEAVHTKAVFFARANRDPKERR